MDRSDGEGRVPYGGPHWLNVHDPNAHRLLCTPVPASESEPVAMPAVRRAGPTSAIPPGRPPFDLAAAELFCYSLMGPDAFALLDRYGWVGTESGTGPSDADLEPSFAPAYDWMRWRLFRRLPRYDGHAPMWVWARTRRSHLTEVLKAAERERTGDVLVTLRVPREEVLLSSFDDWHHVLNGSPAPPIRCPGCRRIRCPDDGCWDGWYDGWSDAWTAATPTSEDGRAAPWWRWPAALRADLLSTWDAAVFDLRRACVVQGCLERVFASWVVDAVAVTGPADVTW